MADRATTNLEWPNGENTPEEKAEEVFSDNKKLFAVEGALTDAMDAIADEHDMMERKYSALDRRLKRVEARGTFLPSANDENIVMWMLAGYFVIAFILPAVLKLWEGDAV